MTLLANGVFAADVSLPAKIEYNRDVRPILSENCFKCHGFDQNAREAGRRLDQRDGALAEQDGIRAIVPGKLNDSDVHVRIHSDDKDEVMPPRKSGKRLSARQIAILDKWIEQGAEYQEHWAYIPPRRPAVAAGKHPIDALVQARLAELALQPSAEADRRTLSRRLHLDLIGLPPKPAELEDFVRDSGADAYRKLVERLLASPHFGERMALPWLDVVRYADSDGYHADNGRNVSPYRDYVIKAFNENKPFDRFTVEQIAGDLLPDSGTEQKVGSAFNRLLLTTEEGGAQAKDYEARMLTDRVRAIGTVWLGQTTGCAQCHDHKFDPITIRDFYALGAFFADIAEPIVGRREPGMLVTTAADQLKLKAWDQRIAELTAQIESPSVALDAAQKEWELSVLGASQTQLEWSALQPTQLKADAGSQLTLEAGEVVRSSGGTDGPVSYELTIKTDLPKITGFRLEAITSSKLPGRGPGRAQNGNFVLTEFTGTLREVGAPDRVLKLSNTSATFEQPAFPAAAAIDGRTGEKLNGWAVGGGTGVDQAIYFTLAEPLSAAGEKTLILSLRHDYGEKHALGKFRISATASPGPLAVEKASVPPEIAAIAKIAPEQRSSEQSARIKKHFRALAPQLAEPRSELARVQNERAAFEKALPRCIVSESTQSRRTVRILPRGNWMDESGEVMEPALPHFLPQPNVAKDRRLTRLDLAQWIVSPENPLTARVVVNRLWKQFFGTGLSKVLDDLGSQGEPPLNPSLLDWLACEFMESGWDIKHMVRLIVTSHAYRQTSNGSQELQTRDPYNRELARQSRWRLDAELVRDNALAIAGLLKLKIGGPSVKPYQPPGYWENLNFPAREWVADQDENQWRRGLYTWWQRSYVHPSLLAFDAPTREECAADRVRSNIPQQALVLLNDPTYVEAARGFAARIIAECSGDTTARLQWAFREALSRSANAAEIETLVALLERHLTDYRNQPQAADALLKVGIAPAAKNVAAPELAAWTNVARVILNLHETITRL